MILVDSSVWIDYFNGRASAETERLDGLLSTGVLLIGDLILTEVLLGFRDEAAARRADTALSRLPCADLAGRDIARTAAAHYRTLRSKGVTIRKTIDLLIGTFCIEHDIALLHADRDFDPLEKHLGLRVFRAHH